MLRLKPVMKTALSLLMSATMALPATAIAKDTSNQPGVMEDVPVIAQSVEINGQYAMAFVMPVDADREEQLVDSMARNRPEQSVLMVSGPEDKALKAASRSGYLKYIKTFILGEPEQAPVNNAQLDLPFPSKSKFVQKLKALTQAGKSDTAVGLYFGFLYSGIQGGFSAYASSSVGTGLAVFSMFALWNSFVLTKPNYWGKILNYGGAGGVGLAQKVASLVGVEISERDKRIYEVVGKFAVSWAVTTAQGAYVKEWSGDFDGLSGWKGIVEGFVDSSISGVQNNYNIWDAAVLKNNEEKGYFTENRTKWYFRWQMVAGSVLESLAFRGVPFVGIFLTTLTATGALYLALNPEKQVALNRQAMKFNVAFRSGVAYISNPDVRQNGSLKRRLAGSIRYGKKACADILASNTVNPQLQHRHVYEDIQ